MLEIGTEWILNTSPQRFKETTAPAAIEVPPDTLSLYAKDRSGVSGLYWMNDAGTEFDLAAMTTGTGAAGRVTFWSSVTALSSDSEFFWDNTNKLLAVGKSQTPTGRIEVFGDSAANTFIGVRQHTADANGGAFVLMKARGTTAAPGTTQASDTLGSLTYGGYSNSAYQFNKARLRATALTLWSATNTDCYFTFELTETGATSSGEKARLTPNTGGAIFLLGGGSGALTTNTGIELQPKAGQAPSVIVRGNAYGSGTFMNYQGAHARGTSGSPTATQLDDVMVRFSALMYGASQYSAGRIAGIDFVAAENATNTANGSYMTFSTTPTGSVTIAERFRIGPAGQWGIGGANYGTASNILKSGGSAAAPSWGTINLLDSNSIGDTLTGTVVRGDLIVGNSTPKWSKFAIGASDRVLTSNGTDPSWAQVATAMIASNAVTQISVVTDNVDRSTTSGSFVDITGLTTTLTLTGGTVMVILTVPMRVGANQALLGLNDSITGDTNPIYVSTNTTANTATAFWIFTGLSAASHTIKGRYRNSDTVSTVNLEMGSVQNGVLTVIEFKK